jgi:hypothetical protein
MTDIAKTSDQVSVTLTTGDVEIGAIELKNATDDTRAKVGTISGIASTDAGVAVCDPLGARESGKLTQHGSHLGTGGQVIAIGAAAVRSTQMAAGTWRISGSGDIWFKQGTVAVTASAAATSTYLAAGAVETFIVVGAGVDDYVSVIQDGAETGNVSITKLF